MSNDGVVQMSSLQHILACKGFCFVVSGSCTESLFPRHTNAVKHKSTYCIHISFITTITSCILHLSPSHYTNRCWNDRRANAAALLKVARRSARHRNRWPVAQSQMALRNHCVCESFLDRLQGQSSLLL